MRITNHTMAERNLREINANLARVERAQRDIATGKRVHRPSDDPTATARSLVLRTNLAQSAQYKKNIQAASSHLKVTDTTLDSYTTALHRMRNLAVQGASGSLQPADKSAISRELVQIKDELRALGNTQVDGRYLFGGLKTQTEPFPTDVTFGPNDNGSLSMEIAPGITMNYNVNGVAAFGDTTPPNTSPASIFAVLDEFVTFLSANTSNSDISDVSISNIDDYLDRVNNLRTDVGGKVNRLDLAELRSEEINVNLENLLQQTEDTDIASASVRLNQNEATYRAALSVGARSIPLSLVDFLR